MKEIRELIEKIEVRVSNTRSMTEKGKYIMALLTLEEVVYEIDPALSRRCKEILNHILGNENENKAS